MSRSGRARVEAEREGLRDGRDACERCRTHHSRPPALSAAGDEQVAPKLQIQQPPQPVSGIFRAVQMT